MNVKLCPLFLSRNLFNFLKSHQRALGMVSLGFRRELYFQNYLFQVNEYLNLSKISKFQ